jgi:aspartate racemase
MTKKVLIGLLGGMAWPSTVSYYTMLNEGARHKFGNNHSANCIIYSYDFDSINANYRNEDEITTALREGMQVLLAAKADKIILCSNTMHRYLDKIRHEFSEELFVDIRDCVGAHMNDAGIKNSLLLGTKFTMEGKFYRSYIESRYNVAIAVPDSMTQSTIHSYIFDELINNKVSAEAISFFTKLTEHAESVILGCTELQLVFEKIGTDKILIDSTKIHATCALNIL